MVGGDFLDVVKRSDKHLPHNIKGPLFAAFPLNILRCGLQFCFSIDRKNRSDKTFFTDTNFTGFQINNFPMISLFLLSFIHI